MVRVGEKGGGGAWTEYPHNTMLNHCILIKSAFSKHFMFCVTPPCCEHCQNVELEQRYPATPRESVALNFSVLPPAFPIGASPPIVLRGIVARSARAQIASSSLFHSYLFCLVIFFASPGAQAVWWYFYPVRTGPKPSMQ